MNSILDVIANYTQLRRTGREWKGLCPFHSEKTPSFRVNEEKGLWYCFGCGEGGDLVHFIEKIEGIDFKGALEFLGIEGALPRPRRNRGHRERSVAIASWAEQTSRRVATRLRDIGQMIELTKGFEDPDLAKWKLASLEREWANLEQLDEDLFNPDFVMDLYQDRTIEGIVNDERTAIGLRDRRENEK